MALLGSGLFDIGVDETYIDPEIDDLINLLTEDEQDSSGVLTKKRINEHFEEVGNFLNYFICYPDMFVERVVRMVEGSVCIKPSVILRKRETNLLLITLASQRHFYNIRFFIFNRQ